MRWIVNDVLMSIFFLVVGLEIRREIHDGDLSGLRRAVVPLMAATGGVMTPALLYLGSRPGRAGYGRPRSVVRGWAIPTPTDIAFAIGVLTILGGRVPSAARVLLLALAVIDDVAAVLIIALFYASGIGVPGLLLSDCRHRPGAPLSASGYSPCPRVPGSRSDPVARAAAGWIHPTLTGVILGLLTRTAFLSAQIRLYGGSNELCIPGLRSG